MTELTELRHYKETKQLRGAEKRFVLGNPTTCQPQFPSDFTLLVTSPSKRDRFEEGETSLVQGNHVFFLDFMVMLVI